MDDTDLEPDQDQDQDLDQELELDQEPASSLVQLHRRIVRFDTPCPWLDAQEDLAKPLTMPLCDTQRLSVSGLPICRSSRDE